jgi:acetylornithine deacetylase/succinyl-diaminopimelate desuccinylase-like protein
MNELLQRIQKAVSIDSTPFVGVAEICAYYAEVCEELSLPYEFVREGEGILVNPSKDSELLIYNTLETKEPGPHSFWDKSHSNPFDATLSGDDIIGLGVASSKLGLLLQIESLHRFFKEHKKLPNISFYGGSYSNMADEMEDEKLSPYLASNKDVLVMRPTSGRLMTGICAKAKIRFQIPLSAKEAELKKKHFHEEDTATQTRIFRGVTTHGASPYKRAETDAFRKLIDYLEFLPQGVLILTMEAGHSTDQVPAEAVLELNLSQPVGESVANKLLSLVKRIDEVEEQFKRRRERKQEDLPRLNIGKLRHTEENLNLDVSFYLPIEVPKERLYLELNRFRKEMKDFKLDYEVRQFMEGVVFTESEKFKASMLDCLKENNREVQFAESVIESVARALHKRKCNLIQFGVPTGLGNIDEPNEVITRKQVEESVKIIQSLAARYV